MIEYINKFNLSVQLFNNDKNFYKKRIYKYFYNDKLIKFINFI